MLRAAGTAHSEFESKIESDKLENASTTNSNSESERSPEKEDSRELSITEIARRCLDSGLSVIPVRPDGSKAPAIPEWKPFQSRQATKAELESWFRNGNGLALVGGEISGNFEILDFDAPELFDEWCQLVEEIIPNLLSRLPLAQTPSGAYHLYYYCSAIEGNQKLAQKPFEEKKGYDTLIETRGEGGYAIVPPSPAACHPDNKPYIMLQGNLWEIPKITEVEREVLFTCARSFDETGEEEKSYEKKETASDGNRVGDKLNHQFTSENWKELLEHNGWKLLALRKDVGYWQRPDKEGKGISATVNYKGYNMLRVFSTNASPFEANKWYKPFAAFTFLEHNKDFKTAVKALINDKVIPEQSDYKAKIMSAADLLAKEFPEPKYAVEGILPEGVAILVGKPKSGKTWCSLGIAIAVSSGGRALGQIPVEKGNVLCLGLEDGARRLQKRLKILLNGEQCPQRLDIATDWRRFDNGGLDDIEEWLKNHPEARLVIIDTLKRVRPSDNRGGRLYDDDYDAIAGLGDLAKQYGVSIVVIHHTRKLESGDPLELVSGSNGLTGAADGVLVLQRVRGKADAELFSTGRDFEDKELALKWDKDLCQWNLLGEAEEYRLSEERREIIDLLRKSPTPMSPKEIAEILNRKDGAVRKMLFDMTKDGQVKNEGGGRYSLPSNFGNSGNNGNFKNNNGKTLFDTEESVTSVTDVTEDSYQNIDDWQDLPF